LKDRLAVLIGTCFYIGRIPGAPGTYASAATALALYASYRAGGWIVPALHLSAVSLLTIAGVVASARVARLRGCEDPSAIVIDEAAGQLLTYFLIPLNLYSLAIGFFLFRLFDIWKPFPIRRAEKLAHGAGVMADDLLAGLYANLALHGIVRLLSR